MRSGGAGSNSHRPAGNGSVADDTCDTPNHTLRNSWKSKFDIINRLFSGIAESSNHSCLGF